MLDIKFVRENVELVKENIKRKFQDEKLVLVDEAVELDKKVRALKLEGETLKAEKNKASALIGKYMREKNFDEANNVKALISKYSGRIVEIDNELPEVEAELKKRMMVLPQIMDPSVPVGKDDSENVEVEKFGDNALKPFEVPYHLDIFAIILTNRYRWIHNLR